MSNKSQLSAYAKPSQIPVYRETPGQDWVKYGEDNLYSAYLDALMYGSAIHNAIVRGTADLIYGNGLHCPNKDSYPEQWVKLMAMFDNGKTIKRVAHDLKQYGHAFINTIWSEDRKSVAEAHHVPAGKVRVGTANEDDEITQFFYCADWSRHTSLRVQTIPAFSPQDRTAPSQMLMLKSYNPLSQYYGLPDYVGALNYIAMDQAISEFHLNNIQNGLFPSMHLSFNGGIPTEEERIELERAVYDKFGGVTAAGRVLISFNETRDEKPEIDTIPIPDQHRLYDYLSGQVSGKILAGHRVTSPLLFGIRDAGQGFGNNANEMREAFALYHTTTIQGYQELLIDELRPILSASNIILPLELLPMEPDEYLGKKTEQAPRAFAEQKKKDPLTSVGRALAERGETLGPEWVLIDSRPVDYDAEERMNAQLQMADVVPSDFDQPSRQDTELFRIRYKYAPDSYGTNSREFCQIMIDAGLSYRIEDIEDAENMAVNPGFGEHGADTYSIWKYKGGPRCNHWWMRETYLLADNSYLSVSQAKKLITQLPVDERDAARWEQNEEEVAMRPTDMPLKGFSPNNPNPPADAAGLPRAYER